ncbi:MAG: hypothetical protein AAGB01_08940 [Cyanobacteria bacterium P01_F01_bin.42]
MATVLKPTDVVREIFRRRRFILSFCFGLTLLTWIGVDLHQFSHADLTPPLRSAINHGLLIIAIAIELGGIGFGLWIGEVGVRALKQKCYPPYNSAILCDTLFVNGWRATTKAIAALMLSIISAVGAVSIEFEVYQLLNL